MSFDEAYRISQKARGKGKKKSSSSKYVRKTSSPEELAAARLAGLSAARARRYENAKTMYQERLPKPGAFSSYESWAARTMDPVSGYDYYLDHRLPTRGIPEPGRGGVWGPNTRPRAFIERYDPRSHIVYLAPKTRGPAKATGAMYSGTRIPKGHLTNHYKKIVVDKARSHANDRGMKVRGKDLDEKYKWARGYLKRNKLGIPRKSAENMGL